MSDQTTVTMSNGTAYTVRETPSEATWNGRPVRQYTVTAGEAMVATMTAQTDGTDETWWMVTHEGETLQSLAMWRTVAMVAQRLAGPRADDVIHVTSVTTTTDLGACDYCDQPATDEVCDVNAMPEGVRVWVKVCDTHATLPTAPNLDGAVTAVLMDAAQDGADGMARVHAYVTDFGAEDYGVTAADVHAALDARTYVCDGHEVNTPDRQPLAALATPRNGWTSTYDVAADVFRVRTPYTHSARTYRRA